MLSIACGLSIFSIVASEDDSFKHISVNAGDDHRMLLWKIQENSVLVVVVDRTVSRDVYVPHIEEALEIIEQGELFV